MHVCWQPPLMRAFCQFTNVSIHIHSLYTSTYSFHIHSLNLYTHMNLCTCILHIHEYVHSNVCPPSMYLLTLPVYVYSVHDPYILQCTHSLICIHTCFILSYSTNKYSVILKHIQLLSHTHTKTHTYTQTRR